MRIEDQEGNLCPTVGNLARFQVSEAGQNTTVVTGKTATVEACHADYREAFNGLALLVVRARAYGTGAIRVAASADGLVAVHLELSAQVVEPDPLYDVK